MRICIQLFFPAKPKHFHTFPTHPPPDRCTDEHIQGVHVEHKHTLMSENCLFYMPGNPWNPCMWFQQEQIRCSLSQKARRQAHGFPIMGDAQFVCQSFNTSPQLSSESKSTVCRDGCLLSSSSKVKLERHDSCVSEKWQCFPVVAVLYFTDLENVNILSLLHATMLDPKE